MFSLLCFLWASTYAGNKYGLEFAPPMSFAGARMLLGGVLMTALCLALRLPGPRWRELPDIFLLSCGDVIFFAAPMTYALQTVSAGEASILIYSQPLMVAALAAAFLGERLSTVRVMGLLMGFAGVVSVMAGHAAIPKDQAWPAYGALLLAAFAWATATIYFRRKPLATPLAWNVALQLLLGGIVLVLVALPVDHFAWRITWAFALDTVYLSIFGIAGAYFLWFTLIERGQVSQLVAYLFMVPLMATIIGMILLGERPLPLTIPGMALTLAGIYVVNRPSRVELSPEARVRWRRSRQTA